MSKKNLLSIALLSIALCGKASAPDSTIEISTATNIYEFVKSDKQNTVGIIEKFNTTYVSNTFNNEFTAVENYDDQKKIEKVELKQDGKYLYNFKPEFSYYSIENIFYSDARICHFPVRFAKAGSTAKVTIEKSIQNPRYFTSIYFPDRFQIKKKEISIIVPRWMNVELKEMNFADHDIQKGIKYDSKTDADIYTYTCQNLSAMQEENNSPGPSYVYPHILVLCKSASINNQTQVFYNTLSDLYTWYNTLVTDPGNDLSVLKEKAIRITKDSKSDLEKIKAIFHYVQESIRYIAFEDGLAGFKPEKADEVLRKKYGDCKGMAHLTKELLKAQGYDARLCWLGTKHIAYNYDTPSMAVDNHMICALIFNNKTYFLDPTETYIGFNEYAERIQGRQVLIENGEKYILSKIPVADISQNIDYEKRILTINGSTLTGKVNHKWKGEEKESILSYINQIKKDKSENAFIKYLSNHNSELTINNFLTSSLTDLDAELTAAYDIDHKSAVNIFNKNYYVDLDFRKELADMVIDVAERKFDYWFDYKTSILRETELILPDNYVVSSLPASLKIHTADYDFDIQFTSLPGKVLYKKIILLKNPNLVKTKFKQWNTDIEKLKETYNESVVLKLKAE